MKRALVDAEGSGEGRGAVAFVVVDHGRAPALLQRKAGLRAVERLDLVLHVDERGYVASKLHETFPAIW